MSKAQTPSKSAQKSEKGCDTNVQGTKKEGQTGSKRDVESENVEHA